MDPSPMCLFERLPRGSYLSCRGASEEMRTQTIFSTRMGQRREYVSISSSFTSPLPPLPTDNFTCSASTLINVGQRSANTSPLFSDSLFVLLVRLRPYCARLKRIPWACVLSNWRDSMRQGGWRTGLALTFWYFLDTAGIWIMSAKAHSCLANKRAWSRH